MGKEKKKQLEQQIKAATGDEKKVKELEKKLNQIESVLIKKDNDTYRRQNAVSCRKFKGKFSNARSIRIVD